MSKQLLSTTVFVCGACGIVVDRKSHFHDPSCMANAIECWRSSIVYKNKFLASFAIPVTTDWVELATFSNQRLFE